MARGQKDSHHVARTRIDERRESAEGNWEHDSHPASGASKARFRNSCVVVDCRGSCPEGEVVVGERSVGDVV